MQTKWLDRQVTGMVVGMVVPLFISFLVYHFRFKSADDFMSFLRAMLAVESLGKLLSVSVMPNLLFFFLGIWSNRLWAARGVLIATVFYGLVAVVLFLIR
jgi:Fe2+ transport system protein B